MGQFYCLGNESDTALRDESGAGSPIPALLFSPSGEAGSATLFGFVLREARLYQLLDEGDGQRLVYREVDGPFGRGEALELVFKLFDHRGCGKQTAVVGKRSEPHQHAIVSEGRHAIADGFGRF